jgi:hypothetical protein
MGFITVIWGMSRRQSEQKVVYAAGVNPASSQEAKYMIQTACQV